MNLKFCIFAISLILFSCNGERKKKQDEIALSETEKIIYTKTKYSGKNQFVADSIKIFGILSLERIDSLYIYIDNDSKLDILLDSSYYVACDTLSSKQIELFSGIQDHPIIIKQGERKKMHIDLRLNKIKYSSNIPYSFNIFYSLENTNDTHFKLSYQFYTPTMWRESNGSMTLMFDTIIDD